MAQRIEKEAEVGFGITRDVVEEKQGGVTGQARGADGIPWLTL
jgi:hypothetical protein